MRGWGGRKKVCGKNKTGLEETGGKYNWSLISGCSVPLTQPMSENINK